MKQKLLGTLGGFGYILWLIISLLYVIAPVAILDLPYFATFILLVAINTLPLIGTVISSVLYVWAFFVTIAGPQDIVSLIFYVFFLIFAISEMIPTIALLYNIYHEKKNVNLEIKYLGDEVIEDLGSGSLADELKKAKSLLDSGVITEEEFASYKKKLLSCNPLGVASLKSPKKVSKHSFLIMLIVGVFVIWGLVNATQAQQNATYKSSPSPSPTVKASYSNPQTLPANGKNFVIPSYKAVCPLSVSVDSSNNYYIYLEYFDEPYNSYYDRELKNSNETIVENDVAFFVRSGCTVEVDVPVGVYKLYYACGDEWYGRTKLFGEDTVYSKADGFFDFYTTYDTAYGHTLELWAQYDGNLETQDIPASQFPG